MKKIYIAPSLEITDIQTVQMIATSITEGTGEGPHVADSKTVNFAEDNSDLWSE